MAGAGSGDKLARGAVRAQFSPATGVSDKTWSDAFDDFDLVAFMTKSTEEEEKNASSNEQNVE